MGRELKVVRGRWGWVEMLGCEGCLGRVWFGGEVVRVRFIFVYVIFR